MVQDSREQGAHRAIVGRGTGETGRSRKTGNKSSSRLGAEQWTRTESRQGSEGSQLLSKQDENNPMADQGGREVRYVGFWYDDADCVWSAAARLRGEGPPLCTEPCVGQARGRTSIVSSTGSQVLYADRELDDSFLLSDLPWSWATSIQLTVYIG